MLTRAPFPSLSPEGEEHWPPPSASLTVQNSHGLSSKLQLRGRTCCPPHQPCLVPVSLQHQLIAPFFFSFNYTSLLSLLVASWLKALIYSPNNVITPLFSVIYTKHRLLASVAQFCKKCLEKAMSIFFSWCRLQGDLQRRKKTTHFHLLLNIWNIVPTPTPLSYITKELFLHFRLRNE